MRLSAEEYSRGLVKWSTQSEASVCTRTMDEGHDSGWSTPLADPAGSVAESPPGRYTRLQIVPGDDDPSSALPITWERLTPEGNIITGVLTRVSAYKLGNIPGHGTFRRIVIEAPATLAWEEDAVIRVGDIVVRTHSGSLTGERLGQLSTVSADPNGSYTIESSMLGTEVRTGRFIELIVDGTEHDEALSRSSAVAGLLALAFGSSVLGPVVFSEPYDAKEGQPQEGSYELPNYASSPEQVTPIKLDMIDRALEVFESGQDLDRALQLALHWFEKGLRSRTPLDELTCYFVGIEAVLNSFVSAHGPIPELEKRRVHAHELKELLKGKLDKETREYLMNSLQRITTRERFDFYRRKQAWEESLNQQFKDLSDARNSAFHGSPTSVNLDTASQARTLLVQMLKTELALDFTLPWEQGPQMLGARVRYVLQHYGHHERSAGDTV